MNKYRCQDSVRRKCDVGHCDGIYYGNDCECAKINDKAAEEPTATNFQRHFGTLEEAAPYLIQYDDYYDCYRTAFDAVGYDTKKEALKASLAWLNAPAEGGK